MCLINHVMILIFVYSGITIFCGGSMVMDFVVQPYPRFYIPMNLNSIKCIVNQTSYPWNYILRSSKFLFGQHKFKWFHIQLSFWKRAILKKNPFFCFVFSGHYTIRRMSVPTWRICVRKPRRSSKPWRKNTRTNRRRSSIFRKNYR